MGHTDIAPQTVLDEMGEGPDMEMLDALEELARAEPDSQFRRAIRLACIVESIQRVFIEWAHFCSKRYRSLASHS